MTPPTPDSALPDLPAPTAFPTPPVEDLPLQEASLAAPEETPPPDPATPEDAPDSVPEVTVPEASVPDEPEASAPVPDESLPTESLPAPAPAPCLPAERVVGLKFREHGQLYFFLAAGHEVRPGEHVVVETEQGLSLGEVVLALDSREQIPLDYAKDLAGQELKPLLRVADAADLDRHAQNLERGRDAWHVCRRLVREHDLDMKLVDVEVLHDQSKILFYFTAPNRIDFRELVKDLVKEFHTRIELRQIGVRHETQMIGAIGNCGLVCCCRQFLRKFAPVTIKMAKEQNLFLNPTKISGMCGRLLCCLSYEQENYEQFHKQCPKIGKKYLTTMGAVKVLRANFFRNSLSVYVEGEDEKEISLEDWQAMEPRRPDPNQQHSQQETPARPERSERQERAPRSDRADRADRQDRQPRQERADQPERPERPRPDKPRKERAREERRQEQAAERANLPMLVEAPPAALAPAVPEEGLPPEAAPAAGPPPAAGQQAGEGQPRKSSRNRRRKRKPKHKRGGGDSSAQPS